MKNKQDFINHLLIAFNNGTLLTPKHDPKNISDPSFASVRSVLSYDLANNLGNFIKEEKFSVEEFKNVNYPKTPGYWVITPNSDSQYSIPASGITATTTGAVTEDYDRLVVVSGGTQGFHIMGEKHTEIDRKINLNKITNKKRLK